jgi:hypothetical protein
MRRLRWWVVALPVAALMAANAALKGFPFQAASYGREETLLIGFPEAKTAEEQERAYQQWYRGKFGVSPDHWIVNYLAVAVDLAVLASVGFGAAWIARWAGREQPSSRMGVGQHAEPGVAADGGDHACSE